MCVACVPGAEACRREERRAPVRCTLWPKNGELLGVQQLRPRAYCLDLRTVSDVDARDVVRGLRAGRADRAELKDLGDVARGVVKVVKRQIGTEELDGAAGDAAEKLRRMHGTAALFVLGARVRALCASVSSS